MHPINPLQIMELNQNNFSRTDQIVYEAIRKNPDQIIYKSISKLAQDIGVSQPAITRFIQTIGFTSYREFRSAMAAWLASTQTNDVSEKGKAGYFLKLNALLDTAAHVLTSEFMKETADYVRKFHTIYASGIGKSYQPAELLAVLTKKSRLEIQPVHMDYVTETCEIMTKDDLLILYSVSCNPLLMRMLEKTSGQIMLVTAKSDYGWRELIDRAVVLPYVSSDPEVDSVSPILFDIFTEMLVQYLISD
jgi:DNA-binding MurR/RpiR family transcriptional regulator